MITYLYWIAVVAVTLFVFWALTKYIKLKVGLIASLVVLFIGWLAYVTHYQNLFVKRYGGVMTIEVPEGQVHLQVTWKDDNLWVENYDPQKNVCYFSEYAKGNLLEGKITIKNCNPVLPATTPQP